MVNHGNENSPVGTSGWRFKLGLTMLIFSVVAPLVLIPILPSLGLSGALTATVSGIALVGAELLMVAAVAVMGKEGYETIKTYVFSFIKRYGPPDEVSRGRYNVGLAMFLLPILFGWFSPYLQGLVLDFSEWSLTSAIIGDLILLSSLFVLGGDFWDKLRSLFLHDARTLFAEKT